jgi:hypothetical protein
MEHPQVADCIQIRRVATAIVNDQWGTADNGWSSKLVIRGVGLIAQRHKNQLVRKCYIGPWTWMDSME